MYKAKTGKYILKNPQKFKTPHDKYMNSSSTVDDKVILDYKSSLELQSFIYCDLNPKIEEWSLEPIAIHYTGIDNSQHRYFPDLYIRFETQKDGTQPKFLVEIKSSKDLVLPQKPKRCKNPASYENKVRTYATNRLKWQAAKKFCEKYNLKFAILTEQELR